ncbi:MAG: c-type cytochrome [Myxococcaceae bacterium]
MTWRRIVLSAALAATALTSYAIAAPKAKKGKAPTPEQLAEGQKIFSTICIACHRADGTGMPNMFPPLAKSDFLMADKERSIRIVINGLQGPVVVNGNKFNQVMPPLGTQFKDDQIAAVLSYVRNSFGNSGEGVTAEEVAKVRAAGGTASGTK